MVRKSLAKLLSVSAFMLVSTFALQAHAQSPHFVGAPMLACSGTDLGVTFKIAGLGNDPATVVLDAASVTKRCVNPGGHIPPGLTEPIEPTVGTFEPDRNGNATGTLFLEGGDETCPGKQVLMVTFEGITLTLQNTGETLMLGNFTCPPQ
jgi:hypothetical protein